MPDGYDLDPVAVMKADMRTLRCRHERLVDGRCYSRLIMSEMRHELEKRGGLGRQVRSVYDDAHELSIDVPCSGQCRNEAEEQGGPLAVDVEKV